MILGIETIGNSRIVIYMYVLYVVCLMCVDTHICIYTRKCIKSEMYGCVCIYVRTDQRVKRGKKQVKGNYKRIEFLGRLGGSVS